MPATTYKNRTTPGVYITELDAFPPSIVGVPTAVPAFIGYTEYAEINGKPVYNKAIRVGSMMDFENYFGGRFKPIYNLVSQTNPRTNDNYDFSVKWEATSPPITPPVTSPPGDYFYYYLSPVTASEFYLYDSMRLFYANGGGNCYVVSVGSYEDGATISEKALMGGLDVIREQVGPTMLLIPDAVLLPPDTGGVNAEVDPLKPPYYKPYQKSTKFQNVIRYMLKQCLDLQDRVAVMDVYSTLSVIDKPSLDVAIEQFRVDVGSDPKTLSYGMAYFPFLHTSVVQLSDFDYTNLMSPTTLTQILTLENQRLYADNPTRWRQTQDSINAMWNSVTNTWVTPTITLPNRTTIDVTAMNQNLSAAIPLLAHIEQLLVEKKSILPPSGAMAGVYTFVDGARGVWNAPANVDLNAVDRTTYKLNDGQQGELNMPIDGKAIDAIREFIGRGTVVWGARTLDGNSNDWRYIQVRRTIIYIEQSIKAALAPFVFAPNTATTWVTVTAMVSNFLSNLWAQGGLMGTKPTDAFTVNCGLGSTMTGMDVLNGYMIVQVTLQMIHPAEFIELTFKQQMQGVG